MTEKGKQERSIRSLLRILVMLTLATLFVLGLVLGDYGLYQIYVLSKNKKAVEASIGELKETRDSLLVKQEKLANDIKYIEKIARERYRMAKKGEKVFRVIEQ